MYPDTNLSDTQIGVGCLVLGAVTMVNWWFAMFSDHWYGDLGRSFGEGEFNEVFSPDAFVEGEDDQGCGGDRGDGSGIEGDVLEGLEVLDQGVGPLGGSPH